MKNISIALLVLTIVLAVAACQRNNNGANDTAVPTAPPTGSPAGPPSVPPTGTGAAVDARALYQQNCIACHAADLRGGAGPNLQTVGSRLSAGEIASVIAAGGSGMPAFKGVLSDTEIQALADWLAAKKG